MKNLKMICFSTMVVSIFCLNFSVAPASAEYTSYSEVGQAIADHTFDPNLMPQPDAGALVPRAVVTTYADRAAFDAAYPGAPTEDFEDTLQPDGVIVAFPPPLNSTTNNAAYAPGAIMEGISIDVIPNGGSGELVVITDGALSNPTTVVGANTFVEHTEITFSDDNVVAVAMDILSDRTISIDITIYGPGDVLQDTIIGFPADTDGEFFGFTADLPITRIVLSTPDGELIDNLSFARASASIPIPTLSEWGVIAMTLFLLGTGAMFLRRRKTAGLM